MFEWIKYNTWTWLDSIWKSIDDASSWIRLKYINTDIKWWIEGVTSGIWWWIWAGIKWLWDWTPFWAMVLWLWWFVAYKKFK
jgi:hypothetical protein